MELICPSCGARYQLPEGSITARGRQVSCMNCGHSWHALPPITLGEPQMGGRAAGDHTAMGGQVAAGQDVGGQDRPASDPRGIQYVPPTGAPSPGERRVEEARYAEMGGGMGPLPTAAETPHEAPVEAGGAGKATPASESRTEQMAEIRQMLAEVQSEERARAAMQTGSGAEPVAAPMSAPTAGVGAAVDEADRARARMHEERQQAEQASREAEKAETEARDSEREFRRKIDARKGREKPKRTDVKRLRRKHDRKVQRHKHQSKAGSGAFLTGFLLIAIIAATMVAMYRLSPQIVARVPAAEEPMREYVATMDRLREGASETIVNVQKWLEEKLGDKT